MKIEPAQQFPHSQSAVEALAKPYGIQVRDYAEATSGIENMTLLVRAPERKYAFRICRQGKKTYDQIQSELAFMAYLSKGGIAVPAVVPDRQGRVITSPTWSGRTWQVVVMEYIEGEHVSEPSDALLIAMATTQARMHLLAAAYSGPDTIRVISELMETEFIPQISLPSLAPQLQAFLQRGARFSLALDADGPTGPCHSDYGSTNILCKDDAIAAVLDFDDLSIVPYVVCLAYTLWHIRDTRGTAAMRQYLAAYEQLRPLTARERQLLPQAALFRHYMISAIKVLSGHTSTADALAYTSAECYWQSWSPAMTRRPSG